MTSKMSSLSDPGNTRFRVSPGAWFRNLQQRCLEKGSTSQMLPSSAMTVTGSRVNPPLSTDWNRTKPRREDESRHQHAGRGPPSAPHWSLHASPAAQGHAVMDLDGTPNPRSPPPPNTDRASQGLNPPAMGAPAVAAR